MINPLLQKIIGAAILVIST